jgi:hypothetical protein
LLASDTAVNKAALIGKIVAQLRAELELHDKAARDSRAEATHEQNKAENKYDTRGLEASYLARGQSMQMAEIALSVQQFESLAARDFGPLDPIDLGAYIELHGRGEPAHYFLGPRAGGTEVRHGRLEILVITPQSPLGRQLMGRRQGERLRLEVAGQRQEYQVAAVR